LRRMIGIMFATRETIEIVYQPLTLYPSPLHKGRGKGIS